MTKQNLTYLDGFNLCQLDMFDEVWFMYSLGILYCINSYANFECKSDVFPRFVCPIISDVLELIICYRTSQFCNPYWAILDASLCPIYARYGCLQREEFSLESRSLWPLHSKLFCNIIRIQLDGDASVEKVDEWYTFHLL